MDLLTSVFHRSWTLLFSILVYPFATKGEDSNSTAAQIVSVTVIIQVTKSFAYSLNKQLHAPFSALYQKYATFTVLLSFFFLKYEV